MKKILFLVLTIILTVGLFTVSNAAGAITERPDIKITIDGVTGSYSNTPIIVNGRTLLPLRELLTNLGVSNDDTHILWNGKDNSVTAIKDSTKVYLKVGATKAKINDKEATIEAAPVNYNGRVYIPARFAAEAFNKVVAWDGSAKRIYIRDKTEYNEVKILLDKAITVMNAVKRYKVNIASKTFYIDSEGKTDGSNISNEQNDKEKMISYYSSPSGDYGLYESYCANQSYYSKFSTESEWERNVLTAAEYNDYLTDYDPQNLINPRDVIYAALAIEKDEKKNLTYLKGDVYFLTKSAQDTPSSQSDIDNISDTYMEIVIDNSTGYITKIIVKDKCQMSPSGVEPYLADEDVTYTYSEINGNFTINLPSLITSNSKNTIIPVEIVLSDAEKSIINQLKQSSTFVAVDGLYSNPYGLNNSQAILFNMLKDQAAFDSYNKLSDNAKIVFSNDNAQDREGEYLGCSEVHSIVIFNNKAYTEIITEYGTSSSTLNLIKYEGKSMQIVIQDKEKNTYKDYK